jgi:hypothetical protein
MIVSLSARIRERPLLTCMVILLVVCLNAWFAFSHLLWTIVDEIIFLIIVVIFLHSDI